MSLMKWFKRLVSGQPHFRIGGSDAYMLRWFLIPRNPWFNVFLHKFLRDDDDRAMHDHPWMFVSFMILGSYVEARPDPNYNQTHHPNAEFHTLRKAPSVARRKATDRHRVTLLKNVDGEPIPCWTIVITGPKVREWGFWCPKRFVPWHEFVSKSDEGSVGKGCGD